MIFGVFTAFLPGRMDGLMARIVGDRYTSGASDRLRLRWIRLNGLLLVFSALILLTLLGRP